MQICMILAHLKPKQIPFTLQSTWHKSNTWSFVFEAYIHIHSSLQPTYHLRHRYELMVIKRQHGGGRFCNQLGNSGRDRKLKGPRSDNSVRLQGQVPPVTRCSVMLNSCGGERKKERGSSCVLKINSLAGEELSSSKDSNER